MSNEIEKALALVDELETKKAQHIAKAEKLAAERDEIALGAFTGNDKSRKRVDEIHTTLAKHSSELAALDSALKSAHQRVADLRAVEAQAADRAQALQLRVVVKEMRAAGEACDVAVSLLVEAGNRLSSSLDAVHAAGFSHPHHQQLLSMAERATVTKLMELPWKRAFPVLQPGQRTSFARFIGEWEHMLENEIARRLGEPQRNEERVA
jgi:chromosome segregation ATPase